MQFYILERLLEFIPIVGAVLTAVYRIWSDARAARDKERQTDRKIETIEEKAEKEPEKVRFAWDLARVKLEAYFDRNLDQVKSIFWVGIFVMSVGFGFVIYGIVRSMNDPTTLKASYIASVAGIITEFIGVTFMVIYRSTLQQAASFVTVLERINSVGMAVQILDSISEGNDELKNTTRAELVKMLLLADAPTPARAVGAIAPAVRRRAR